MGTFTTATTVDNSSAPPGLHYVVAPLIVHNDQPDRPMPNPLKALNPVGGDNGFIVVSPTPTNRTSGTSGTCSTKDAPTFSNNAAEYRTLPSNGCYYSISRSGFDQPDTIPADGDLVGTIYTLLSDEVTTSHVSVWLTPATFHELASGTTPPFVQLKPS